MSWIKKVEVLATYFIRELEETCREKFYKWNTDQFTLVLDWKGAKVKDLQDKQAKSITEAVVELLSKYYPSIIHKIFILNAPLQFDDVWEDMNDLVGEDSSHYKNFIISKNNTHPDLKALIPEDKLPQVYGGKTEFDLSKGLFNEVGPWSMDTKLIWIGEEENKFPDQDDDDDVDEGVDEDIKTAIQGIPSFLGNGGMKKNDEDAMFRNEEGHFNLEALGELINQTPNATPMNTYADDEDDY